MKQIAVIMLCLFLMLLCACSGEISASISGQESSAAGLSVKSGVQELVFEFTGMTDVVSDAQALYVGAGKGAESGAVLYRYSLADGTAVPLYKSRFTSSVIYGLQLSEGQLVFYDSDARSLSQDLVHVDLATGQSTLLFSHTDESMFVGIPRLGGGYVSFLQLERGSDELSLLLYHLSTGKSRTAARFAAASGSAYHSTTDEAVYWCEFSSDTAEVKKYSFATGECTSYATSFARIENIMLNEGKVYAYAYPDKQDLTVGSVVCFDDATGTVDVLLEEVGWHFLPADNLLAAFRTGQPLQLFDISDGTPLSIPELFPSADCRLSADGRSLLIPTGENTLYILNLSAFGKK